MRQLEKGKLVVATHNAGKLAEFADLIRNLLKPAQLLKKMLISKHSLQPLPRAYRHYLMILV